MANTTDRTSSQRTLRETITGYDWRRIAFSLVVLAVFGLIALFGLWRDLAFILVGWFDAGLDLFTEDYEAVAPHRGHIFIFGLLTLTAVTGLAAGLWKPRSNPAGQWMALLPWAGLLVALVLADFLEPLPIVVIFGGLTVLATLLHPAGLDLVRTFSVDRLSPVLLALVVVAAVPLLAFAATQVGLQTGAIEPAHHGHDHDHGGADHEAIHEEHVESGHFAGGAAFAFALVGLGVLASLRPDGWWVPAWITGIAAAVFGLVAIAFTEAASTAEPVWGLAAVLWGVAFVAATEYSGDETAPTLLGRWRSNRATGASDE